MLSPNGKNASEPKQTPLTPARYSFFSSLVNTSGLVLKYLCHSPSFNTKSQSSDIYISMVLSLSALPSSFLKSKAKTLSACLKCHISALLPASLVQCILDC